ncbi:hypothetical protein [Mesoterricola sediminis]|uniref:Uncharacterized protein n=1 Tax=Mesoterricola sediminis TaxID=2927980 RepID=A0AA48GQS1_9BACT|nr:hypothetical protein [Mesoterricola sediminis]BDU75879.1 hypothetical protein METESE_08370 [Mesoterricola sediminis]
MSNQRGLGSLADLAKILEEATNPESTHREDRRETKPKASALRKGGQPKKVRVLDPKRKVWYEKRLKEQAEVIREKAGEPKAPDRPHTPELTKAAATRVGGNLLETLANAAKDAKAQKEGKQRTEAWRRKPGDPIF